jgi:hypothetical protein
MPNSVLQSVFQQASVRNAGKRVVISQLANLILIFPVLGDIGEQAGVVGGVTLVVGNGGDCQQLEVEFSCFAPVPDLLV